MSDVKSRSRVFEQGIGAFEREAKAIIRILTKRFQSVPQSLAERIHAITELECLEKLADFAYDCKTLDEFGESLK